MAQVFSTPRRLSRAATILVLLVLPALLDYASADQTNSNASISALVTEVVKDNRGSPIGLVPYATALLPYLRVYLGDADSQVRVRALYQLDGVKSAKIISVLAPSLRDSSIAGAAGGTLFYSATPRGIRASGGRDLRDSVMWGIVYAGSQIDFSTFPMILAAYQRDPEVVEFLKGLQRMDVVLPKSAASLSAYPDGGRPPVRLQDLGASCQLWMAGNESVPYEFALHLALAELHQKADEEAVLWRLRGDDLPSIEFTLACACHISNKRLLLELVEQVRNDDLTRMWRMGLSSGGHPTPDKFMRVCDYATAMLARALQVDVGIPDATANALAGSVGEYRSYAVAPISPVRQYTPAELATAYARLKAAVDKLPDN